MASGIDLWRDLLAGTNAIARRMATQFLDSDPEINAVLMEYRAAIRAAKATHKFFGRVRSEAFIENSLIATDETTTAKRRKNLANIAAP